MQAAELLCESKAAGAAPPSPAMRLGPDELAHLGARYDAMVRSGFAANPPPLAPTGKPRGRSKHPPPVHLLIRLRGLPRAGVGVHARRSCAV